MTRRMTVFALLAVVVAAGAASAYYRAATVGEQITTTAQKYLASLDEKQRATSLLKFDTPKRVDWHFIPKDYRKGLQIKHMKEGQRKAALALLESCLSKVGYDKATKIMELESVLAALEGGKGRNIRDAQRYYYTLFGEPKAEGKWGLSIEGHHLSLNFVIEDNKVIGSTPAFFAANPGEMKSTVAGVKKGTRVLGAEEKLAFQLVNSLEGDLKKKAIIAEKAPREIRAAGSAQPPKDEKVGVTYDELADNQKNLMRGLVITYLRNLPRDVQQGHTQRILDAGPGNVRFAWAGATKPGVGHYYRIQGPTFLIEFVNTQPDAAGNPANHIHCVFRDMAGDFAIPLKK